MKKTPNKISKYPKGAWFTYADRTCDYGCQAVEYLWWGYAAYTGREKIQILFEINVLMTKFEYRIFFNIQVFQNLFIRYKGQKST